MLKLSEHQDAFGNDDRRQTDKARKEAEALFRPKPKIVETSRLTDTLHADTSLRKPRTLSASAPPLNRERARVSISSGPKIAVSGSQVHTNRERLDRARAAIFEKQHELRAKLAAIDIELRAIDAYEAARRGKTPSRLCGASKATRRPGGLRARRRNPLGCR